MTNHFAQRSTLSLVFAIALITSLFVPMATGTAPAAAAEPRLSVTPSRALPGDVVSAEGRRFPANAEGQLVVAQDGSVLASFQANRSGSFGVQVTVPGLQPGSYDIVAIAGDATATSSLEVLQ